MPATNFSRNLQFSLAFCSFFVAFGGMASCVGSWSIQGFFLMPPCALASNSTPCCKTCLGVSNLEYGFYIAVPSAASIGSVVMAGLLIDVFGLPITAIASALANIFGNTLRAIGSAFILNHKVLLTCLIFGEVIMESSNYALLACREYIAIRYFTERNQPLVLAVATGISYSSIVLSGFVAPPLAAHYGVPTALWTFVGISLIGLIVGVILALIFSFSSAVQSFERELCNEKLQRKSCREIIHSARTFQQQYWFIFFALGLAYGSQIVFDTNSVIFQTRLANISALQAGTNTSWAFFGFIVFSFLTGCLLWATGPRVSVSLFATLIAVSCIALTFIKPEAGLASSSMFSSVFVSMKSLFGQFVPPEALGFAGSLMWAVMLTFLGIFSGIIGFILEMQKGREGAVIALCFIIGFYLIAVCLQVILWYRYGDSNDNDANERLLAGFRKLADDEDALEEEKLI